MVHLYNGILRSREKEGAPTLCDSMDVTGEHYAKGNKPGGERQIPYDLTCKSNLINKQTNEQNKLMSNIEPLGWKHGTDSDQRKGGGG